MTTFNIYNRLKRYIFPLIEQGGWRIGLLLLPLFFTACLKDQDDYFSESASARMSQTLDHAREVLRAAEYGWEFEYYPDRELSYGGLVYTIRFDSLTATVACSLIPDSTETTFYRLTNDNGPVLTFDTYNPLLHYFATPNAEEYEAKDGDFEFVIDSIADDYILLYGKRTGNTMHMRRLYQSPDDYAAKTIAVSENFLDSLYGSIGNLDITGKFDLNNKSIRFYQARDTFTVHFTFNDRGIRFYRPLTLGGKEIQTFDYDLDTNVLTCTDPSGEGVYFQGLLHDEEYVPYGQYEGTYLLRYFNGQRSARIQLVPNRIEGTYWLTGLSPKYKLRLNYDFNTGQLTLPPQMVGELGGRGVYFLTWDLDEEGYSTSLWVGEECSLLLQWNRNRIYPVYNFVATDAYRFPCNSAILVTLYNDSDGELTAGNVNDASWLTNQSGQFPYLNNLTRIRE